MQEVIVDTCVWIEFFNRPASRDKAEVDALLDADAVVICGVVLAEIVQGLKTGRDVAEVLSHLDALRYLEVSRRTWESVGRTSMALRRRGLTIPLTDIVVAELAKEHGCSIFTLDPHFKVIPGVPLHAYAGKP